MAKREYPEGYLPEIKQNINRLLESQMKGEAEGIRYNLAKLNYFAEREARRLEALELPQLDQEDAD